MADHPWALTMAPDDSVSELGQLGKGKFEAMVKLVGEASDAAGGAAADDSKAGDEGDPIRVAVGNAVGGLVGELADDAVQIM